MSDADDLDALVTELNAAVPQGRNVADQTARLRGWLEESLAELVKRELVDRKDAMTRAPHPEELERLLT